MLPLIWKKKKREKLRRQQNTPCMNLGKGDTLAWIAVSLPHQSPWYECVLSATCVILQRVLFATCVILQCVRSATCAICNVCHSYRGVVCRDEGPEGNRFFRNFFIDEWPPHKSDFPDLVYTWYLDVFMENKERTQIPSINTTAWVRNGSCFVFCTTQGYCSTHNIPPGD